MTRKEVFTCDFCCVQSQPIDLEEGIPYSQGWKNLNSFEFKSSKKYRHETIMKHFCSNECLIGHIQKFISEQEQIIASKNK